jgi:hypothetical protein
MTDDFLMRMRLQQVVAYRQLCNQVRRSGRENVFFALLMLLLAYLSFQQLGGGLSLILLVYVVLALGEFAVGLFKFLHPSAEGILLDALVLLVFAGFNFVISGLRMLAGMPPSTIGIVLGVFMLYQAVNRFKLYGVVRKLFAQRPGRDLMAWVDDLVHEIRHADPQTDDLALDLPTSPHWKVKLLGTTAFFAADRGGSLQMAGPDEFQIQREKTDHGTGRRRARLRIGEQYFPEFEIADASWENYQKWLAANTRA